MNGAEVLDIGRDAIWLTIQLSAPVLIVGLVVGVWADRLPRRFVMIAADLTRVGTQSITAFLLFTGTAHVWQLAVLQGTAGAAAGFFNPASTALIPQTVALSPLWKPTIG